MEREKIGDIAPGDVISTKAFALKAKYIIYTFGLVWNGGEKYQPVDINGDHPDENTQ